MLTVLRGKVMVADGKFHGDLKDGQYLKRASRTTPGASSAKDAEHDDEGGTVPQVRRPEVLVYEETGKPAPKPGEALVRVRAVGINHVDLDHRAGTSRIPVTFPHILGRSSRARSRSWRPGGPLKEGDRVWVTCRIPCGTCEFCLSGRDNLCSGKAISARHARRLRRVRESADRQPERPAVARRLRGRRREQIAFGTAWHVLINRGGLQAGQSVLIQAAGSGIGSAAVQVARLAGAAIIATASSDQKLERPRRSARTTSSTTAGRISPSGSST